MCAKAYCVSACMNKNTTSGIGWISSRIYNNNNAETSLSADGCLSLLRQVSMEAQVNGSSAGGWNTCLDPERLE